MQINESSADPERPDDLAASLAMCDRGMAELDAGGGKDAIAAMEEIGRQRGYSINVGN